MKHINNADEFVVILSREEITKLMACCNAASIRWHEKSKAHNEWTHLRDMADEQWHELYHIINPEKEV